MRAGAHSSSDSSSSTNRAGRLPTAGEAALATQHGTKTATAGVEVLWDVSTAVAAVLGHSSTGAQQHQLSSSSMQTAQSGTPAVLAKNQQFLRQKAHCANSLATCVCDGMPGPL
jgi:hypothetical protein